MVGFDLKAWKQLPRPSVVQEAARAKPRPWWATLAWVVAVILISKAVRPPARTAAVQLCATAGGDPMLQHIVGQIVNLLMFSLFIVLCMAYVVLVERRRVRTLGFVRRRALATYAAGLLLGGASFALVYGIAWVAGAVESVELNVGASAAVLLLLLVGYMVQSMGEETLCRGFMISSLGARYPMAAAIAISSATFGIMHSLNPGISVLAVANITLIGIALGLMYVKSGSLWLCGGFHCMWNFAQGPLLGISVSGTGADPSALLQTSVNTGNVLLTGGAFGLEASIVTTVVSAALIGILAAIGRRS